ncbi:uncharacterized protein FOMMEDRAFT_27904 [Fomitiporia mediterranea MF3/22]|uniref:uncharacterized protein n=1 Tax=Fomitiporia mediterranea (strain MF3/22) TaxID=694068 RepID=UPI000440999E|nr:uncharacterized protein FOMMEDRAFT_27904 [Fomitiporia mediterranea MF3/22]EJD04121.1 hypothetical protein FOMMEDRAFT_27904 [Fomitiporia mediterranea MF3/22]
MPHNIHTAENACAFLEKKKKWTSKPDDWNVRDVNTDDKLKNWNKSHAEEIIPDSDEYEDPSSVASTSGQSSKSRWNDEAVNKKAASIRIINKIDDVSPVGPDFIYLEASRNYAEGICQSKPDFLPSCDCKDGCKDPLLCPCVAKSQCIDDNGKPSPAYDRKGLFLFNHTREVVECNQSAAELLMPKLQQQCVAKSKESTSGSIQGAKERLGRAAERFRSAWNSARTLMKRGDAATLGPEDRQFSFDLDTRDDDPEYQDAPKYTIAAHASGVFSVDQFSLCIPKL